jgi:mannose-6-phosphate isomerase-like protein (cupin superfamily)
MCGNDFGPGDVYLGGEGVHLAMNETGGPVRMVVTEVERPRWSAKDWTISVPPPPGCGIT